MPDIIDVKFTTNKAVSSTDSRFTDLEVDSALVIQSWKTSMFSFEWLSTEGGIKSLKELSAREAQKRLEVEQKLERGEALEKPVLGIGIMDNIEIGSGRAEFLTLASMGLMVIPVHIPKSNESDFKAFVPAVK